MKELKDYSAEELKKISQIKNHLVVFVRESNHESQLKRQLNDLKKILPVEKKKWQYNRLSSTIKSRINETVELLLKENKDFNQFKQLIKEEGKFRNSLYRKEDKNEYYQNKMKDMNVRFGNALLKNMKDVEKEIVIQEKVESKEKNVETKPKKLSFKEQRELEEINKSLPILEAKKEELTNLLSDPNLGYDKIATIGDELQKIVDELEEKEFRWLELSE